MSALVIPAGGWRIHNYKKPDPILLGYEYEIDTHTSSNSLEKLLNELLPKHYSYAYEGLGHSDGYEIKSSVAPLRTTKQEIRKLSPIIQWDIPSPENNDGGIHINIARNSYTRAQVEKVFQFLHDLNNREWLLTLSERSESSFSLYSPPRGTNSFNWGRYYGIITTRKTYAYEFRMFKAKPHLLIPACEFIHALFDLAPQVEQLTTNNIKTYIERFDRYRSIRTLFNNAISLHHPSSGNPVNAQAA